MSALRTLPEALADAAGSGTGYSFIGSGGETRRSYAQMQANAFAFARALGAAGIRRGDCVALVLPDAEDFLTALFGASIAGVLPASLYSPATAADLPRYFELTSATLRACAARAVVTTSALAPGFETLHSTCPALEVVLARESLAADPISPTRMPALDDIALIQFTSGSTSTPKGVVLTHRILCANIDAISGPAGMAAADGDTAVSWLPLNHDMGLVGMALGAMYAGRPAVFLPPSLFVRRPVEWLRAIARHRGTISFAPNFAYDLCVRRVKDHDLDGLDLSCWRVAGCGAEPIHAPTLDAFAQKMARAGFRASSFLPSYGLAEHVVAATFPPRDRLPRVDIVSLESLTERRIAQPADSGSAMAVISCGLPLPGHQLRIVDPHGRPVAERQVGEILLAGPSVMLGYYRDDALTSETIRDGWLHTGDLGYLSGGELFVCGRAKDLLIVNGRKYHPQDLEWAVDDLAGVRRGRVVAFGACDDGRPDRVIVVVEPSGTVAARDLIDSIRRRISDLFGLYVDEVAIVPSGTIGRTTSGKVQRSLTKARYERGELVAAAS
jgi:fatty-acyl-CoA synthase